MALTDNRESRPWGPTRIALLAYGFVTAVGFIHAQAYYGSFGIDILNYVAPIDLLFIALDHIDKVLAVTFTIVPVVLVWVVVGLPAFLIFLFFIIAAATLSIAIAFLMVGASSVDAGIGGVRSITNRVAWLRQAIQDTRRNRIQRTKAKAEAQRTKGSSQTDGPAIQERLRLVAAYRNAMKSSAPLERDDDGPYREKAEEVLSAIPWALNWLKDTGFALLKEHIGRWRNVYFEQGHLLRRKPWAALSWQARLVVLGLSVFLLCCVAWSAWRTGKVDAGHVEVDDEGSAITSWSRYAGQAICPSVPIMECESQVEFNAVYVIPTVNVASLDFDQCGEVERGIGEDVRVSVRHDLRQVVRAHEGCLKYLGATGSMQFFADLYSNTGAPEGAMTNEGRDGAQYDAEREGGQEGELAGKGARANAQTVVVVVGGPTGSGNIVGDWLPACDMKLAAWVGPFAEAAHTVGYEPDQSRELDGCFEGVQRLEMDQLQNAENGGTLKGWWKQQEHENIQRLILVGRADREPISNDFHLSNFALAQSRADWVKEQLAVTSAEAERLHVLSIPGGPATPDSIDPCDRVVEIHMCMRPAELAEKDADGRGVKNEDEQGAGSGVAAGR